MTNRIARLIALTAMILPGTAAAQPSGWGDARQALVVTTSGWDARAARVQRWELNSQRPNWRAVGAPVDAVVGRAGMAWGTGLHSSPPDGPRKREGDGRAPAGIFRLSTAFGYAPTLPGVTFPYRQATPLSRCVDDAASAHYNRWVEEAPGTSRDWSSHEDMRRQDDLYRLGVWVDHNSDPPVAQGGSCIFLHLWAGPEVGTAGCTAFPPQALEEIVAWLRADAHPVLIQMPEAEYAALRGAWELP